MASATLAPMLPFAQTYVDVIETFAWSVPARFNIGVDVSDRVAAKNPSALAIRELFADGRVEDVSFGALRDRSNQLAHVLDDVCAPGDRVAIFLSQCVETALGHIAAFKRGAISLPLFVQFGPDALLHRLGDSGARVVITDATGAAKLAKLLPNLPHLETILCIDEEVPDTLHFDTVCAAKSVDYNAQDTGADDPALLIYTSGTTGPAKGALHGHRVLLGHLPGVEMSHDFFPQTGDCIWTPADWAWIGGLLDVLLPALYHGVPVVAHRFAKFDGQAAFDLINKMKVRNAFLPPTALKMMRRVDGGQAELRSVASGGETLGAALLEWGRSAFGVTINEFYGQTECNMIVSSCAALAPAEPGVMGWPVPGHRVCVVTSDGALCAPGQEGDIAVAAPDPVMFLRYWNNPDATHAKFREDAQGTQWLITGDRGFLTPSGRIVFKGRDDDVITSAGYRIGPAEIEDCLLAHPAVALAGVVGLPDPVRGEAVTAFVTLAPGVEQHQALAYDLIAHVRARLAGYEAPRAVHFIEDMPLTTTGKIIRRALREWGEPP